MYYLNKVVWFLFNPVTLPLMAVVAGLILMAIHRRWGLWVVIGGIVGEWFVNTLACVAMLGLPLEKPYFSAQKVDSLPTADAIVLLGGGMSKSATMEYPDMNDSADRVWHAARLYRAGKAPIVVVSGCNDEEATVPLLLDLGVPCEAIVVDNVSRNTYENSRFTETLLAGRADSKKVLLVTSAWHMTRARGNFAKTGLEVVPAPADFRVCNTLQGRWVTAWFLPNPGNADLVCALAKEWMGRLARR